MSQITQSSPSRLKKSHSSTSALNKSRVYLPSRYAQVQKQEKSGLHEILNSIETQTKNEKGDKQQSPDPKFKLIQDYIKGESSAKKINKSLFKSKPLKREDNDMVQFKQIFLNPRQESLKVIQKLKYSPQHPKNIVKQYEKLLKFERGQPLLTEQPQKEEPQAIKQSYEQAIDFLQTLSSFPKQNRIQQQFYQSQIVIQVPNMSNTQTIISGPKPIISPSLPSNYRNQKDLNLNLKQLLLRSKAGTNSDDIQKQAHLSFYLGEVYSQKKVYRKALKFYKRFLGFAKMMEDRVGMGVGANRVGVSHYNCKQYQKSISFHNQNLKLSDQTNYFCGLYNIGLCYRKLKKPQQALQYFEGALNCAQELGHQQSEQIAFCQMGLTYKYMQQYQQAIQCFEESLKVSRKTKNKNLKLNNLQNILKISSMLKIKSNEQLRKVAEQAFEQAKQLGQLASVDVLRCNIGVLRGCQILDNEMLGLDQQPDQIEQIND